MPKRVGGFSPQDSPTAWFVELEIARKRGDFDRAAKAQAELQRLGVSVRYRPRRKRGAR